MKIYEDKKIEYVDRQISKTSCDICENEIKIDRQNVDEVVVKHRKGYQCSDGGGGYEITNDICTKCFYKKIIPFLESLGVKPEKIDWEW